MMTLMMIIHSIEEGVIQAIIIILILYVAKQMNRNRKLNPLTDFNQIQDPFICRKYRHRNYIVLT